jgi:hypothetical protein
MRDEKVRQLHQVAVGVVDDPPLDVRHSVAPAFFVAAMITESARGGELR